MAEQGMMIGVLRERARGETRVALVPGSVQQLVAKGHQVVVESAAGNAAGYPDSAFEQRGAVVASSAAEVLERATHVCQIRAGSTLNGEAEAGEIQFRPDQRVIGLCDALSPGPNLLQLAEAGVVLFALEMMPRITRAQSMDVLSSQATVAGYRAVTMAANHLPRMFPMLMTAAGTLSAAKVLVIGAGVAGLQAIAVARRLGAVVSAYDVRPAVKEQVESLGARFLELPLEPGEAEDKSGYARAMDESFYARQRELLATAVRDHDVVITTALVPGKPSPRLITSEMVRAMASGSVIVDLAAERGGNCEITRPDETVYEGGVTIFGPTNLPATVAFHASQMFGRNVANFLIHLAAHDASVRDTEDEIVRSTLIAFGGEIVNPAVTTRHSERS